MDKDQYFSVLRMVRIEIFVFSNRKSRLLCFRHEKIERVVASEESGSRVRCFQNSKDREVCAFAIRRIEPSVIPVK